MIGERWAMLIVRDLLIRPRRYSDLLRGLPGIPTNILSARLKELEQADVLRRRLLQRPAGSVVYELTPYGYELEPIIMAFGRWGAKSLGDLRPGEALTPDAMITALRASFRQDVARRERITYELRMGELIINARVDRGKIAVAEGSATDADLTIEAGPAIRSLLSGELHPVDAVAQGMVRIRGDIALLERFVETFHIDAKPGTQQHTAV